MNHSDQHDAWSAGRSYDEYMGRWSRGIAMSFVGWLDQPASLDWLDVGCGTGALSATVLGHCAPRSLVGVDPSDGFVQHARISVADDRARFDVGTAEQLPLDDDQIDVVTSALAYNFVPDRAAALRELRRVARPNGTISFYVWDYPGGGVGFIDVFWKAAATLDDAAAALDEADRFSFCTSDALHAEVAAAGCADVEVEAIEAPTTFADFDAFWGPFTLGAGPAPGYLASLSADDQDRLQRRLRTELGEGRIDLTARAWAVRSRTPG
jgi:ubiquinone/menaquinone biosynthesis C-methylase UbiE